MTCNAWSVVVVPFPFVESAGLKFRPAVVLSERVFNRSGLSVMAMVTSARHASLAGDIPLTAGSAGLAKDSLIRMKLFTLDNRLIKSQLGTLPAEAGRRLSEQLRRMLKLDS